MIPRDEAEAYWEVTRDCLIQFHGLAPEEARVRVAGLRERLARTGMPIAEEMIYHDEPFYVACDLAGTELDPFMFDEEYQRLLERPFPTVGNVAAVREPGHAYHPER
ncbi:MAG TPA: hypothetical protein VK420_20930 [Longimicrobium sp.]|nr:hypothetical protein [Longimicrobium sp.]